MEFTKVQHDAVRTPREAITFRDLSFKLPMKWSQSNNVTGYLWKKSTPSSQDHR
jgi:hypothetical protein